MFAHFHGVNDLPSASSEFPVWQCWMWSWEDEHVVRALLTSLPLPSSSSVS